MASRLQRSSVITLVCVLALFAVGLVSPSAQAQEPGVTVINVPPDFSSLDIRSRGGLHFIDLVVSDYNSWEDIQQVDVEVLNEDELQVAHVLFRQYAENQTPQDEFLQPLGQLLVLDLSSVSRSTDPQTIQEKTEMHITFVLSQVTGRWLRVTATDLAGLSALAQVEYLTGVIGGAAGVPSVVLMMLAIAGSVVVVSSRLRRERSGV